MAFLATRTVATPAISILNNSGKILGSIHHFHPSDHQSVNKVINTNVVNRNPRNLEKLCIAKKPKGWEFESPPREFWHKLYFVEAFQSISGRVEHYTGKTVIHVSSKEWALRKHLYSGTDIAAAENVAKVLAYRCLESGIYYVHSFFTPEQLNKEKIQIFKKTLEETGLVLSEPETKTSNPQDSQKIRWE